METSVDAVIDKLGFGSFNRKIYFIIGMFWMLDGIEITLVTLVGPKLQCEWNMSSFETALTSAAVFVGMGCGAMYWGWLGDKHGRKIILVVCSLLTLYFGLLTSTADNFVWFLFLRFFVGIGTGGIATGICYIGEFTGTEHRGRTIITTCFFFISGSVYAAVVAYISMNTLGWRIFVLLCAVPLPFIILLLQWLPESIRYLQNTGNTDAVMKLLHFISNENKIPLPKHLYIECELSKESGSLSILLKRQYIKKFFIMAVLWVISLCSYYSVVLMNTLILKNQIYNSNYTLPINAASTGTCHTLTKQEYLQNVIVVSGELVGILFLLLVVEKLGRKKCLALTYIATSTSSFCLALPLTYTSSTIVSFILRASVVCICQMLFIYTVELFPTTVRNTVLGFCNGLARWSITIAPFLVTMLINSSFITLILILGGSTLLCSLLCCFLPETAGLYLTNK